MVAANAARDQQDILEEDSEVAGKLSAMEKRGMFLDVVHKYNPDLDFEQDSVVVQTGPKYFDGLEPKVNPHRMPFCAPLLSQLEFMSKPPSAARKEPFRLIDKYYQAVHTVENSILKPRFIPSSLLDEVENKFKANAGASGDEARLKKELACGQKELDALRDLKQSSSYLRVINNQELGLQTLGAISEVMNDNIQTVLSADEVPPSFRKVFETLEVEMANMATVLSELKYSNTFMARAAIF
jgi:hypothetical protein